VPSRATLAQFERDRMDEMGSPSPPPPSKKKNSNWQKREAKRRRARIRNRQAREDDNVVQFRTETQVLTSSAPPSLSATAREQSNRQRNESRDLRELDTATSTKDPPQGHRRQAKSQKGSANISSTFVEATRDARTPRLLTSSTHLSPQEIRRDVTSSPPTGPWSQRSHESSPASLVRESQRAQSSTAPGDFRLSLSGLTRGVSGQHQRPRPRGRSNNRRRGAKRMPQGQRSRSVGGL